MSAGSKENKIYIVRTMSSNYIQDTAKIVIKKTKLDPNKRSSIKVYLCLLVGFAMLEGKLSNTGFTRTAEVV